MTITNGYATRDQMKTRLGIGDTDEDDEIDNAVNAASRFIDQHCRRRFYQDGSASARTYYGRPTPARGFPTFVEVDDFHTTTGLVVKTDTSDDGTFDTTWSSDEYQLEPLNGVVDGIEGWPYTRLVAVKQRDFPYWGDRARVEITADWGWASVPPEIGEACRIQAARIFRRKATPEGIAGGFEVGAVRVSSRVDPDVEQLLAPFVRTVWP